MPVANTRIPHCGKRDAYESLTVCSASATAHGRFPAAAVASKRWVEHLSTTAGPATALPPPQRIWRTVRHSVQPTSHTVPKEGSGHERLLGLQ
jgi:hypothetical protein